MLVMGVSVQRGALYEVGAGQWFLRCLTFELPGRQRRGARPGLAKMYRVPPDRAWWPAVGAPLERGVRRRWVHVRYGSALALANRRAAEANKMRE